MYQSQIMEVLTDKAIRKKGKQIDQSVEVVIACSLKQGFKFTKFCYRKNVFQENYL